MGFNIGGFLGAIGQVAPAFGPIGQVVGAASRVAAAAVSPSPPGRATVPPAPISSAPIGTQAAPAPRPIAPGIRPAPVSVSARRFTNFGSATRAALSPAGRAAVGTAAGAVMGFFGNGDTISEILKEARENMKGATKNKIIDAAKVCGIERAADMFGISENQVCQVILAGRTRRRRGITPAQIATTRRVIRFNKSLTKQLRVR